MWLSYEWCREVHELKVSSTAGASNSKDSPAGNALHDEATHSAVQLAAAQDACSMAKSQAASLQKTVQQLTGGPLVSPSVLIICVDAVLQETGPQCTQHTTDAAPSSIFASAARSVHDSSYDIADEKSELQTALTAAKLTEQEAVSSAQRFEAELSDLAGAYNNLEVHSYQLEAQIKRLQNQAAQAPSTAGQTQACTAGQNPLQHTLLAAVPGSML